eukprot:g135.t1
MFGKRRSRSLSSLRVFTCALLLGLGGEATNVEVRECADSQEKEDYAIELAQIIVGEGVNVTSATIIGDCIQFGIFSSGSSVTQSVNDNDESSDVFINYGVTISTGHAYVANRSTNSAFDAEGANSKIQPYDCTTNQNMNADVPNLYQESCVNTNFTCNRLCDAAELKFDFVITNASSDHQNLTVNYIFASEEYSEYVGYQSFPTGPSTAVYKIYSDSFAFFLDGTNIALADDGSIVSTNTINKENPCGFDRSVDAMGNETFSKPYPAHNVHQLIDNDIWAADSIIGCDEVDSCGSSVVGELAGKFATEFDGFTKILRARQENIVVGVTHTMQFSIADVDDELIDSQVFIQAGSFSPYKVGCTDPNALNYDQYAERDSGQCFYKQTPITVVIPNDASNVGTCSSHQWYMHCPALASFTSTKSAEVDIDLCDAQNTASCSDVGSLNVTRGSYNTIVMDLGGEVPAVVGNDFVLKFAVSLHETQQSVATRVFQYDDDTVTVTSPSAGDILFGCGSYDVSWSVSDAGNIASASLYDVRLFDAAHDLHTTIGAELSSRNVGFVVDSSFSSGAYSIEVSSSNYSTACVPIAYVNFTISQDVPSSISMSLDATDVDAAVPGIQWRMCTTAYIGVTIDSASPVDVAVDVLAGDLSGGLIAGVQEVTSSSIVPFYSGPGIVSAGSTYVVSTRVVDSQLATCIPAINETVEILRTSVENITTSHEQWSSVCGQEEGKTYRVDWELPVLQYVDIELCHDNESTCEALESALCSNFFIADDTFWSNALFAAKGSDNYFVRVKLNSGENECVEPAILNISLTTARDAAYCPETSAAFGSSEEDVALVVLPIVGALFVIIVGLVVYYRSKIRITKKKANDMMVKQEIRHVQENTMDGLEMPTSSIDLVCDLPGATDTGNGGDLASSRLESMNQRLKSELAKEKRLRAAADLRASEERAARGKAPAVFDSGFSENSAL